MNAAACPPCVPTLRTVTAGLVVAVEAVAYSVARTSVPTFGEYRSASPWNWIVSPTNPVPGLPALLSMSRYASDRFVPVSVSPTRLARSGSGRIAMRLPPPVTQVSNMVACAASMAMSPRMTTS